MRLLELILILINFKFYFNKPKKERVLLYDSHSKPYAEIYLTQKNLQFTILDMRV